MIAFSIIRKRLVVVTFLSTNDSQCPQMINRSSSKDLATMLK